MDRFSSEHLTTIIAEILGVPVVDINAGSGMDSIERWDSHAVINMVIAIELEAGLQVGPDELEKFTTFHGILQLLASKGIVVGQ